MRKAAYFACPVDPVARLEVVPRLESWDAAGTASQVALGRYLDHLADLASPMLTGLERDAALCLRVHVPAHKAMTSGGGDLDNYLFPVARRFGAARFASAWAEKTRDGSTLCIGRAAPSRPPEGFDRRALRTTASSVRSEFKEQIAAALPTLEPGTQPVEVQIAYTLSSKRNWAALWKPTIDAMAGVLGGSPGRRWAPNDDRIVRLGLHRTIDESIGWDVGIELSWLFLAATG